MRRFALTRRVGFKRASDEPRSNTRRLFQTSGGVAALAQAYGTPDPSEHLTSAPVVIG
jgi:hypothetical protein